MTQKLRDLAREYCVMPSVINNIIKGGSWKNV